MPIGGIVETVVAVASSHPETVGISDCDEVATRDVAPSPGLSVSRIIKTVGGAASSHKETIAISDCAESAARDVALSPCHSFHSFPKNGIPDGNRLHSSFRNNNGSYIFKNHLKIPTLLVTVVPSSRVNVHPSMLDMLRALKSDALLEPLSSSSKPDT